jgi:hypothetical protein
VNRILKTFHPSHLLLGAIVLVSWQATASASTFKSRSTSNGGSYQKWYRSGERFINVATGFCLDGNGAGQIYTHDCNNSNYQNWY